MGSAQDELERVGRDVTNILERLVDPAVLEGALPHLHHLPRIADALERIAAALEASNVRAAGSHH